MNIVDDGDATLDQPLLKPPDHTLLLRAVQQNAPRIVAAMGAKARLRPVPAVSVLSAVASLQNVDDHTRQTAVQVLAFLAPLSQTPLPASYAATLATVDDAMADSHHPMEVLHALLGVRDAKAHERVKGFQIGVGIAIDLLGDALESAAGVTSAASVFGRLKPVDVARSCARGCVFGAMAGSLGSMGANVGAIVGGVGGSAQAAIEAATT